ncbi:hypothetical protein I6J30_04400 [Kytococcus sedentarius]|nr:hypothetical protein I6J30_04400 [Kytococcus sedentarius]
MPTAVFRDLAPGPDALRRAVPDDLPAIVDAYEAWARQHNGPLTRRGPLFPADRAFTGGAYTLAEREGRVTGVLRWDRTSRYGEPESTLEVHDLIALDAGAAASLLTSLSSHSAVAPRTVVSTSGLDALHLLVPSWQWQPVLARRARPGGRGAAPGLPRLDVAGDDLRGGRSGLVRADLPRCRHSGAHGRGRSRALHPARVCGGVEREPVTGGGPSDGPGRGGRRPVVALRHRAGAHPRLLLRRREARG